MSFTLTDLPYAYDALQPYMSRETLEFHHDKHHLAYVNTGNNLMKGTEFEGKSVEEVVTGSYGKNQALFNNAGQHYNHIHFWKWMKPNGGGAPSADMGHAINQSFGSFDKFKEQWAAAGAGRFGSGWVWLLNDGGKLSITSTPNQDNPLMEGKSAPILGLDVWEHAYYLRYQNKRPDYISAWWNVVNWEEVERLMG